MLLTALSGQRQAERSGPFAGPSDLVHAARNRPDILFALRLRIVLAAVRRRSRIAGRHQFVLTGLRQKHASGGLFVGEVPGREGRGSGHRVFRRLCRGHSGERRTAGDRESGRDNLVGVRKKRNTRRDRTQEVRDVAGIFDVVARGSELGFHFRAINHRAWLGHRLRQAGVLAGEPFEQLRRMAAHVDPQGHEEHGFA